LHKYLYANGDPVDARDPRGREAAEEYSVVNLDLVEGGSKLSPLEEFGEAHALGIKIANCFTGIAIALGDFISNNGRQSGWGYAGDAQAVFGCILQ
jgi:hypothetical protein